MQGMNGNGGFDTLRECLPSSVEPKKKALNLIK
jgi:hypothetical protein